MPINLIGRVNFPNVNTDKDDLIIASKVAFDFTWNLINPFSALWRTLYVTSRKSRVRYDVRRTSQTLYFFSSFSTVKYFIQKHTTLIYNRIVSILICDCFLDSSKTVLWHCGSILLFYMTMKTSYFECYVGSCILWFYI